jgi:hypothetical protein
LLFRAELHHALVSDVRLTLPAGKEDKMEQIDSLFSDIIFRDAPKTLLKRFDDEMKFPGDDWEAFRDFFYNFESNMLYAVRAAIEAITKRLAVKHDNAEPTVLEIQNALQYTVSAALNLSLITDRLAQRMTEKSSVIINRIRNQPTSDRNPSQQEREFAMKAVHAVRGPSFRNDADTFRFWAREVQTSPYPAYKDILKRVLYPSE